MRSHVGPNISLAAVIVRACDQCGGGRAVGKPCEGCGNKRPAEVRDLGVIASSNTNKWKQFKWNYWGAFFANRRIRKINKEQLKEYNGGV